MLIDLLNCCVQLCYWSITFFRFLWKWIVILIWSSATIIFRIVIITFHNLITWWILKNLVWWLGVQLSIWVIFLIHFDLNWTSVYSLLLNVSDILCLIDAFGINEHVLIGILVVKIFSILLDYVIISFILVNFLRLFDNQLLFAFFNFYGWTFARCANIFGAFRINFLYIFFFNDLDIFLDLNFFNMLLLFEISFFLEIFQDLVSV